MVFKNQLEIFNPSLTVIKCLEKSFLILREKMRELFIDLEFNTNDEFLQKEIRILNVF